jgi:hypothetical protein
MERHAKNNQCNVSKGTEKREENQKEKIRITL